jgi:hypothetical protein
MLARSSGIRLTQITHVWILRNKIGPGKTGTYRNKYCSSEA